MRLLPGHELGPHSSHGSTGLRESASKFTHKANRQASLRHGLLVGNFSSSSQGPLHRATYDMAAGFFFPSKRSEGKRKRAQNGSHSLVQCGSRLDKGVGTKRWGTLEA